MSRFAANIFAGLERAGTGIYRRLAGFTTAPALRNGATSGNVIGSRLQTQAYDVREQMLAGTVYAKYGGYHNDILKALGKPCDYVNSEGETVYQPPITPYYNPVPAIVGCYANALGGRLGEELKLEQPNGDPLDDAVADAIARIWRWSNLDTKLEELTTLAANQGTAGIRIVAEDGDSPRVYLQFDKPSRIKDAEEDTRGNLVNVLLTYQTYYSEQLGIDPQEYAVKELIGKDAHSVLVGNTQQLEPDQLENALGVCPYVLMRHTRRTDDFFGRHAYEGSENAIHGINWALSQLDEAAARAISETIFMTGAGDRPDSLQLGRFTAIYVKLAQGVPQPGLEHIVPQLAIGEMGESIARNVEFLWVRQPELILNSLKILSGTSGETMAHARFSVEAAVMRARRSYEDALIRAIQIGLSAGIMLGLWDLGTGTGTREAADRAYDDGQGPEAFRFADRPALPETPQQQLVKAQASVAEQQAKATLAKSLSGVSGRERLRVQGYSDDDIEQMEEEIAEQDTLPEDEDDEEEVE